MATGLNIQETHPGWRLFALSFTALFLELMVIRWVPSVVPRVAYYSNLMLISSFLGLGIGVLVAPRNKDLFRWFAPCLGLFIGFVFLSRQADLPGSDTEARFFHGRISQIENYYLLLGLFATGALPFVCLGQKIGRLFPLLPSLSAYAWDLGGSLAGTLCFGVFSFTFFRPVVGFLLVMAICLALANRRLVWSVFFALILLGMGLWEKQLGIYSPYYYISYQEQVFEENSVPKNEPPADLRSMKDPPIYTVSVNHHFYHYHGTLDVARYTDAPQKKFIADLRRQYLLPHTFASARKSARKRVAVLGAGGGMDVEAALLSQAEHVDAVEIDPGIIALSRRLNASGVYFDPRVTVVNDDARAFLSNAAPGYDMIVFGFLDSQALFSSMSNIRLDGFTYTVESFQAAFSLLDKDGMLVVSFATGKNWLGQKLYGMVATACAQQPLCYQDDGMIILCAFRGTPPASPPASVEGVPRTEHNAAGLDLATDDWPFLYLSHKTIPTDYLVVIVLLAVLSCLTVLALRCGGIGFAYGHFFFLGWGFLLLQTKSIGDCSLYFGTTWLVTLLVVAGILIMVLLANVTVMRWRLQPSLAFYLPLFAVLGVQLAVPNDFVLGLPLAGRLLWTLLAVPLPVFFAGLIFSTTFRQEADPAVAFGANLVGAMIGGFAEYLGMLIGSRRLMFLVIAAYAASLLCRWAVPRRPAGKS